MFNSLFIYINLPLGRQTAGIVRTFMSNNFFLIPRNQVNYSKISTTNILFRNKKQLLNILKLKLKEDKISNESSICITNQILKKNMSQFICLTNITNDKKHRNKKYVEVHKIFTYKHFILTKTK